MQRRSWAAMPCLFLLSACGSGADDPEAPGTLAATDLERLDELWSDVAITQAELRLAQTELVIDCLEADGFTVHNIEEMTEAWRYAEPSPSAMMASTADATGHPTPAEAEERALGIWLDVAEAYDDAAGIALREAEDEAEPEDGERETVGVDLSALDAFGEGWESLPAADRMEWEIAYQGSALASASDAAGDLAAEDMGLPPDDEGEAVVVGPASEGCQGEVLTGLYGEPRSTVDGIWVWGPFLETPATPEPFDLSGVPEGADFLACLAEAGYRDWALSYSGGLELYGEWREQYLPEAVEEDGAAVGFDPAVITDADRERYEQVKAAEFEAAAAIAACDQSTGYTAAVAAENARLLTARLLESAAAQQDYLTELEDALSAVAGS